MVQEVFPVVPTVVVGELPLGPTIVDGGLPLGPPFVESGPALGGSFLPGLGDDRQAPEDFIPREKG